MTTTIGNTAFTEGSSERGTQKRESISTVKGAVLNNIVADINNVDSQSEYAPTVYLAVRSVEIGLSRKYRGYCLVLDDSGAKVKEFAMDLVVPVRVKEKEVAEKYFLQVSTLLPGHGYVMHSGFYLKKKYADITSRQGTISFIQIPDEDNFAEKKLQEEIRQQYLERN